MRKFQYLVSIDLDDEYLEDMVKENPGLIKGPEFEGVAADNFVTRFAERMAPAINDELLAGLGDAGKSTVSTIFAGEVK